MSDLESISFHGQVVGVTGGASGIGKGICHTFAALGADVSIADIDVEGARDVADTLSEEYDVDAIAVETNVKSYDSATEWVETTIEDLGRLDVLVNNAGGATDSETFLESSPDEWEHVVDLCYFGTMNCTHAALPHMIDRGSGVVINFASDSYKGNDPSLSVYGGSKAANVAFTKTVAREVGKEGVRMNVVSPGSTWTPATEDTLEAVGDKMIERSYALDRLGQPEDIANTVAFLASDAADWITAEVVSVNGGYVRG